MPATAEAPATSSVFSILMVKALVASVLPGHLRVLSVGSPAGRQGAEDTQPPVVGTRRQALRGKLPRTYLDASRCLLSKLHPVAKYAPPGGAQLSGAAAAKPGRVSPLTTVACGTTSDRSPVDPCPGEVAAATALRFGCPVPSRGGWGSCLVWCGAGRGDADPPSRARGDGRGWGPFQQAGPVLRVEASFCPRCGRRARWGPVSPVLARGSPRFHALSDTARPTPSSTWASREKWKSLDIGYLLPPLLLSGTAALASGTSSTVGNLEE